MLTTQLKLCRKCGVEKPLLAFYNDKSRRDGKYPNCIECHGLYVRNRYAINEEVREKVRKNHVKYRAQPGFFEAQKRRSLKHYSSLKGRAQSLLRNAQRSSDGCSLTLEWIIQNIQHGYCPITGIPFDLSNKHQLITGRARNPYSPSLDRINPKGSYSPVNTRVVIWQYNMMKGELSDREILELCRLIILKADSNA